MQWFGDIPHYAGVYLVYIVATASPGPSNLAIMGVAMARGRLAALALAAGVICGSLTWATLAGLGVSAVLATYAQAIFAIKIAGGIYLLYLAWKSARAAFSAASPAKPPAGPQEYRRLYRRGLLLHLTNPKAILAWISIMAIGLTPDAPPHATATIIAGCALLGISIFGGYALLFSAPPVVRFYARCRRAIEGLLALMFGAAGLRLLTWQA